MIHKVKLGTRGSRLALAQSQQYAQSLMEASPGLEVELVVIRTAGDKNQKDSLSSFGGKGIFTKELEEALYEGSVDFAVHSLKDLPTTLPEGLALAPSPQREDPRDVFIGNKPLLETKGAIGTGSLRRQIQVARLNPECATKDIRGNIDTRVRKWREGDYTGIVLAAAGLARLGLEETGLQPQEVHYLDPQNFIPAPNQGILGLEYREDREEVRELLSLLADEDTALACRIESDFLESLGGGCNLPAGCYAKVEGGDIQVLAFLASPDGSQIYQEELRASRASMSHLGSAMATTLKSALENRD